jgi:hypothetical protein
MDYLRQKFDAHGLLGFIYSYYIMFSDRDKVVYELLFSTIGTAAAAILVVLVFFVELRTVAGTVRVTLQQVPPELHCSRCRPSYTVAGTVRVALQQVPSELHCSRYRPSFAVAGAVRVSL